MAAAAALIQGVLHPYEVIRVNKFVKGETVTKTVRDLKKEADDESISLPARLYRGAFAGVLANAVSWYLFQSSKQFTQKATEGDSKGFKLLKKVIAQGVIISITHPVWMTKLHLELPQECLPVGLYNQRDRPWIWTRGYDIVKNEGAKSLYSGIGWSSILSLNPLLHGHIYQTLKKYASPNEEGQKPSHIVTMTFAGIAQIMAIGMYYPIVSLRTRAKMIDPPPLMNIRQLYRGIGIQCVRSGTSRALMYGIFEGLIKYSKSY